MPGRPYQIPADFGTGPPLDPELVPEPGRDLGDQDVEGALGPDTRTGDECDDGGEESAGKDPVVSYQFLLLHIFHKAAVYNGRCMQVFLAESDQEREEEHQHRYHPPVSKDKVILEPDGLAQNIRTAP